MWVHPILESIDTFFGVPYPYRTWDMLGTLSYPCSFFEHNWDANLLFLFSFNLEHLFSYLLYTLLDILF